MKTNFLTLVVLSICLLVSTVVYGQDKKTDKPDKTQKAQQAAAKKFINATPTVIKNAIAAQKKSKKESEEPYIAKAFDHQKHAIELYNAGTFEKAIYHSLKARKYAEVAIKENKGSYDEQAEAELVFKDFKDPKDKENKAFYKGMKKVFNNQKDAGIGEVEDQLDKGVEVSTDDSKVDMKLLVNVK